MSRFSEHLTRSRDDARLPCWREIYAAFFPDMVACIAHQQSGEHQHAGIDRSVILASSKQVLIDEKLRDKDYQDIALEFVSNDQRHDPGWVCKQLRADFICYAFAPSGRAFLLPVPALQSAWSHHGNEWRAVYGEVPVANDGYNTWFCPVPIDKLYSAMGNLHRVSFTPVLR